MLRVFLMAFSGGLMGLVLGAPLAGATNIFRDLGVAANFAVLLFFLTGSLIGAIAGATDALLHAIQGKNHTESRSQPHG